MEKMSLSAVSDSNVVSIDSRKNRIPTLTELAKIDPDVKEMIKCIVQYDLRDKAVALFSRKLSKTQKRRRRFFS